MRMFLAFCAAFALPVFLGAAVPKKSDKPEKVDPIAFLKKFDANNDGKLDKEELSSGLKSLKQNSVTTKNDSWKKFDEDGDDKISLAELKKLFDENSKEKADPVAFMEKFDANHDGKLDTFEMGAGIKSLRPTALTAKSDFWKKFDANYDGKISPKELEKLLDEYNK